MPRITAYQIDRVSDLRLIGIHVDDAALIDIATDITRVAAAIAMLDRDTVRATEDLLLGHFGAHEVRLLRRPDGHVSIFIDGPQFSSNRTQSAAVHVPRCEIRRVLAEAVAG